MNITENLIEWVNTNPTHATILGSVIVGGAVATAFVLIKTLDKLGKNAIDSNYGFEKTKDTLKIIPGNKLINASC